MIPLTDRAREWFVAKRGISEAALRAGGVCSGRDPERGEVIVFPYTHQGEPVGHKYRGPNKTFWQSKGGCDTLWNIDDAIRPQPDHVFLVEGEIDALSLMTAGIWNVVSVPAGAPMEPSDVIPPPEQDRKYRCLWKSRDDLIGRRIVIVTDNDGPGRALREDIVRRLGRGNCDVVEWPDGIKDANEYLLAEGPEALREYIYASRIPYPVRGLSAWNDVLPTPPEQAFPIPITGVSEHVRLAPGTISVITGIPNHGKSAFAKHVAVEMIMRHGWNICIASLEDAVYRHLMPEMIHIAARRPHSLDPKVWAEQATKLSRHVCFIYDEGVLDEPMTVEWLVETVRVAKMRYGIDMLIIDPWNELEHIWSRNLTESQYVGRALRDIRRIAVEMGIHVMIVAHPTKMKEGEIPTLYDISGSSNWANKVDIGLVVHQPNFAAQDKQVDLLVKKIKRKSYGKRGTIRLRFDEYSMNFAAPDTL